MKSEQYPSEDNVLRKRDNPFRKTGNQIRKKVSTFSVWIGNVKGLKGVNYI